MARLPKPGCDAGNWGEVLDEFLSQEHHDDGTFKNINPNAVNSAIARTDPDYEGKPVNS